MQADGGEDLYDAREREFVDEDDAVETEDIIDLIVAWGSFGERLFMDDLAMQRAMVTLCKDAIGCRVEDPLENWKDIVSFQLIEVAGLTLTQHFTSLKSYAFYGIWPRPEAFGLEPRFSLDPERLRNEREVRLDQLARFIAIAREFRDSIPSNWPAPKGIDRMLIAAEGRLALDTNGALTPEQLAALGDVGVRTVKNLLMPSSAHPLRTTEDGRIPASEALGWLEKREAFRESVWHLYEPFTSFDAEPEEDDTEEGEILFLPVARDGSIFEPESCCWNGRYVVGAKGAEEHHEEFREALAALTRMATPRWRRPNERGNWGIVRGDADRWLRRTAAELGLAAASR